MTVISIDKSQRKAALLVGIAYLVAMATSIFAEVYARGSLVVAGDPLATAQNIIAHQGRTSASFNRINWPR